ncbi:MAG: hypothetical protein KC645_19310, partial [Gemmatimonadetes bacterium]|nr:hypothetical protein [Gemmatimonadota bacterium]
RATIVTFRVRCSDERYTPSILHLGGTFRDGTSVFFLEASDPGSNPLLGGSGFPDIDRYQWNLTDCAGNSALRAGSGFTEVGFLGRNLASPGSRSAGADTVRVVMVLSVDMPDAEAQGLCTSVRIEDREGNTTDFVEAPIAGATGSPPVITTFNAFYTESLAASWLQFALNASDPDGDFAGAFVRFTFKDGTFGSPDGQPDLGSYGVQGFEGNTIQDLLMRTQTFEQAFTIDDLTAVTVYAVDRKGNFSIRVDNDPVR